MPVSMGKLIVHQSGRGATSCPGWFFGGPHQWPASMPLCTVKRRKKEKSYGTWWTWYHEWKDGRCIHCCKTRQELRRKPKSSDCCTACGVTRSEAFSQAQEGVQPKLNCEDFGHKVHRKALARKPPLALISLNGKKPPRRLFI